MKLHLTLLCLLLALLVPACQRQATVCPPDSVGYFDAALAAPPAAAVSAASLSPDPVTVEINGRPQVVDRVIHGPICHDTWQGTVYVACDIQIAAWEEAPRFLEECALTIEPGTTVYVAAHNDAPYYKGCSCHTAGGPAE